MALDPNIPVIEYTSLLQEALKLNLPLVCANPDYESVETNANLKKQIATAKVNAQRAATIEAQKKIEATK